MAFKAIKLRTGECDLPPIKVREVTKAKNGWDLKFKNQLDGDPDATIEFFDLTDKGGSAIGGFCDGMTDTELTVPGGGNAICEPTLTGDFSYTVAADGHADLDPVIILEPPDIGFREHLRVPDYPTIPPGSFPGYVSQGSGMEDGAILLIGVALGLLFGRLIK